MITDLDQIQQLVDRKAYELALTSHIWFHNHILEHDPSNLGVRLSFALSNWMQLGEVYPPALAALIEIRDRKELEIRRSCFRDEALFQDVVWINHYLDQIPRSVSLFEELEQNAPKLANDYWPLMRDSAINQQRFDLLKRYGFDFDEKIDFMERVFNQKKQLYSDPEIGDAAKTSSENHLSEQVLQLIDVALKLDDITAAKKLHAKGLELLSITHVVERLQSLHIWDAEEDSSN